LEQAGRLIVWPYQPAPAGGASSLPRYAGGGLGWGFVDTPEQRPPPQPSPGVPGEGVSNGIILSPHLDDAALSLGAWMLWKGNDRDYYRVVDVFSTVSW